MPDEALAISFVALSECLNGNDLGRDSRLILQLPWRETAYGKRAGSGQVCHHVTRPRAAMPYDVCPLATVGEPSAESP